MLEVENLSLNIKQEGRIQSILHNVTVSVGDAEIVAIVGETGSGKTVTAKTIMGILPKNSKIESGKAIFNGIDLLSSTDANHVRRKIPP